MGINLKLNPLIHFDRIHSLSRSKEFLAKYANNYPFLRKVECSHVSFVKQTLFGSFKEKAKIIANSKQTLRCAILRKAKHLQRTAHTQIIYSRKNDTSKTGLADNGMISACWLNSKITIASWKEGKTKRNLM